MPPSSRAFPRVPLSTALTHGGRNEGEAVSPPPDSSVGPISRWLASCSGARVGVAQVVFSDTKGGGGIGGTNKKMNIDANKNKTFSGLALLEFSQLDIRVKKITFFNY